MIEQDESAAPLAGRVALVTGASRGLGRAVARLLGAQGAQVIAVARTVGALEELDDEIRAEGGPSATLTPFDLKDGDAIDRLGGAIFQRWGKLDYLVHAAAHGGMLAPASQLAPKDAQSYAEVNFLAVPRLIRSMDPLLHQAESAAAAFVVHRMAGKANWAGYGASKAAGEAVAQSYAAEAVGVRVMLFEPEPMGTALRSKMYPGQDKETLATPEAEAARLVGELIAG